MGDFSYFGHSSVENLEWSARKTKILKTLSLASPDVLTLQEVQMELNESQKWDLPGFLKELENYSYLIPQFSDHEWNHQSERNKRVLDDPGVTGVAILFKKERFEMVNQMTTSRCLIAFLKSRESGFVYSVVNVHLEGAPELVELRGKQLHSAVKKSKKLGEESHLIVMGDFNSGDQEVNRNNETYGLQHVESKPTWSTGRNRSKLDHILCDESFSIIKVEEFATENDLKTGMPNDACGSDHAPVAVICDVQEKVVVKKVKVELNEERRQEIEAMWAEVEKGKPKVEGKGKPNEEQMQLLKAFAVVKKQFLAQFAKDSLDLVHAKKISK